MKKCQCHVRPKTVKTHYRRVGSEDGWQLHCKVCQAKYAKRYYQKNQKRLLGISRRWHQLHPEKTKANIDQNRKAWMKILKNRGLVTCKLCGYDRCFAAIDLHHDEPDKKRFQIGLFLRSPVTEERLKELDNITALCATCHRELHENLKTGGSGNDKQRNDFFAGG